MPIIYCMQFWLLTVIAYAMSSLLSLFISSIWGYGLKAWCGWLMRWYVCVLHHVSNCFLSWAIDGHIMRYSIISSCQSAVLSEIVKRCWSWVCLCKQRTGTFIFHLSSDSWVPVVAEHYSVYFRHDTYLRHSQTSCLLVSYFTINLSYMLSH